MLALMWLASYCHACCDWYDIYDAVSVYDVLGGGIGYQGMDRELAITSVGLGSAEYIARIACSHVGCCHLCVAHLSSAYC